MLQFLTSHRFKKAKNNLKTHIIQIKAKQILFKAHK